jgi:hypothetical protein
MRISFLIRIWNSHANLSIGRFMRPRLPLPRELQDGNTVRSKATSHRSWPRTGELAAIAVD